MKGLCLQEKLPWKEALLERTPGGRAYLGHARQRRGALCPEAELQNEGEEQRVVCKSSSKSFLKNTPISCLHISEECEKNGGSYL